MMEPGRSEAGTLSFLDFGTSDDFPQFSELSQVGNPVKQQQAKNFKCKKLEYKKTALIC